MDLTQSAYTVQQVTRVW